MAQKLEIYEQYVNTVPTNTLELLRGIVALGRWDPLIEYISKDADESYFKYQFALEYAIHEGQTVFIKDLLNHAEVIPHILYSVLYDYAKTQDDADPNEFKPGSEVTLKPHEMRGKEFYHVMPLAELCQYQLNKFKNYLQQFGLTDDHEITIDVSFYTTVKNGAILKIPSATFGRIEFKNANKLPVKLLEILNDVDVMKDKDSIFTDESPLALLLAIKDKLNESKPDTTFTR